MTAHSFIKISFLKACLSISKFDIFCISKTDLDLGLSYNLNRSFEDDLKNQDNLLNSISSSDYPDKLFNGISFSTLHELRKSNLFRVIIGQRSYS